MAFLVTTMTRGFPTRYTRKTGLVTQSNPASSALKHSGAVS